ncbi:hypothetical protein NQ317_019117 [Molorchus minor]|uniref:U1-type domain-containing protein n=1 Tax=Molorchus minor TaxID=1323400 RepID=A0ABQ9J148_9CUCU|nr:hypothetical protein NQ317_019117 [Molorchus minor]
MSSQNRKLITLTGNMSKENGPRKLINIVENNSSQSFDKEVHGLLNKGLKFALPSSEGVLDEIVASVENKENYYEKVDHLINNGPYKRLARNPLPKMTNEVRNVIKSCNTLITPALKNRLHVSNPIVPRLYGLPKIHKPGKSVRPIVSAIGSPTYLLWLTKEFENLPIVQSSFSPSHYPGSGYQQSAYPQYQQTYSTNYGYQNYGTPYPSQTTQPAPPGDTFSSENWGTPTVTNYGGTQKDAVAQEMFQQKAQLIKQREDYVKKVSVLRHELEQLRLQKQELIGDGTPDRDLANILRENDKLQEEIQGEKDVQKTPPLLQKYRDDLNSDAKPNKSKSPEGSTTPPERYCYVHYDTGLHWCRLCDEFPETAKDFLLHLQDKKHREMAKENDVDNTPWHKLPAEPVLPSDESAPKKRIPIKGLQFFISAPSWYCKLCDTWIGDLHCASHHLKSQMHFQNYENFVVQNSHWEMEWLKDREKAMTRNGLQESSDSDAAKKRKKHKNKRSSTDVFSIKNKKKKKRSKKHRKQSSDSSSSSSSSETSSEEDEKSADRSRSIRVAMRNMKQRNIRKMRRRGKRRKRRKKEKTREPDDPLINQWMTVSQPQEKDKRLLEDLKERMKQKQELEKSRQLEMEQRKRKKEKEEREMMAKKERDAKEAAEIAERERKRKEQEEYERIRDRGAESEVMMTMTVLEETTNLKGIEEVGVGHIGLKKNPEVGAEVWTVNKWRWFQPGNLARAFIPKPDVVCFPKLSTIPPITIPPPPAVSLQPTAPDPPKISEAVTPKAPPPPKIVKNKQPSMEMPPPINLSDDEMLYANPGEGVEPSMMIQYYQDYNNSTMYPTNCYEYEQPPPAPQSSSNPIRCRCSPLLSHPTMTWPF